jgi:hypothetical protein
MMMPESRRRFWHSESPGCYPPLGYLGHCYSGEVEVHVDKRHRGRTAKRLWRWMNRLSDRQIGGRQVPAAVVPIYAKVQFETHWL